MPFWRSWFDELDRVFDNFRKDFENVFALTLAAKPLSMFESTTVCDLVDEVDKFGITADMPRMKKEEINLNVGDDYIDISDEHKESEEEKIHQKRTQRGTNSQIPVLPFLGKYLITVHLCFGKSKLLFEGFKLK